MYASFYRQKESLFNTITFQIRSAEGPLVSQFYKEVTFTTMPVFEPRLIGTDNVIQNKLGVKFTQAIFRDNMDVSGLVHLFSFLHSHFIKY